MPKSKLDPLPSAAFHILLALADEDRHGYGIMREVAELTSGKMRLGPGTLYGSIKTLLDAGLIAELQSDDRRRYYRLTPAGRKLAKAETARLVETVRIARAKKMYA